MDTTRFDALAKRIGAASTRRGALLLGALGLGGLGLVAPDTAAGKCKEPCGPCKRCKKGKCKRKSKGASCPGGKCLSNGTCGISCTAGGDECPDFCFCAKNTEGQRFCHQSNTICGVHDTCSRTKECLRGQQCQDCQGANHCFPLCAP